MSSTDPARALLRHTVATVAYRGGKVIRGAPASFAEFSGAGKTPAQILAHIGDLLDWGLSMANGQRKWKSSEPLAWDQESERFFAALKSFDDYLNSAESLHAPLEKLFQGPIADALSHIGQIAILRRISGVPIKGENFYVAQIAAGQVGRDQPAPEREF